MRTCVEIILGLLAVAKTLLQGSSEKVDALAALQSGPPSLPLGDIYRDSYNEIEYLKIYLSHFVGPNTHLFKDAVIQEIDDFQVKISKEYMLLFKEAFPHRANEPFGITEVQHEKSWENVDSLLQKLDALNWKITHWADRVAFVDLNQADIRRAILAKGEILWARQFQDIKRRIDEILTQFAYRGHPLKYVGSLNNGTRGAHKARTVININDFDVDLFVVHPVEWHRHLPVILEQFPENFSNGKIFPLGTHMQDLQDLSHAVGRALARELKDYVKDAWKFIDNTEIVLRERDSF
ncbi:uncharacterized protein P174DRAFT_515855 [Aspergillus novofumigatus IBT 16806]|uniref:Uncharacterized protein n=1 Tax=Aspergillus novofumigatus (strain IBT 16806) TaxID=1392255 RepID=A0A2I1BWU2_ASPN1|nr:uncharacterized protein P174DRAFT_515855 [Aspergillus novofumigatus IBT 16806]PKX89853.1 hypothetical protein P174DRAFT_515855 [Aspergillus novofumigatus IBT 16806]